MFFRKRDSSLSLDITTAKGFEEIYRQYWEKVFAVCYNSTEDPEVAQNMTQDIFKSVWERRNTLKIEKAIEHYLVRAAKNKVAEHFRNEAIRKKHFDASKIDYCVAANCTEEDVAFTCLVEELNLIVDQLPCQCRKVFKMSREKGLTNRQIASQLNITERAVEYHITKALRVLKQNLTDYEVSRQF
ncbi:MAG: RNA polymerase sigma-70 factor [Bacteroidota bacterium]